jgi:catechol 2,3-dioxygenase-like lactoylglutathione lyase family enzyme
MIDHLTLRVRDLAAAKAFYAAALAPLGYAIGKEYPEAIGMGVGGLLDFWLTADVNASPQHLAFSAHDRKAVDAFHAAALGAGGRDNGPAGLRAEYHPNYYGAFVFDPSGHNVEAVCHRPPALATRMAKGPKGMAKGPKGFARKKMAKGPKGLAKKVSAKGGKSKMAKGPKGFAKKRMAKGPKG